MDPKRIILIRHGESEANVDKYMFGRVPDYTIELTEKGREQAEEAGKRLKEVVGEESVYFYVSLFGVHAPPLKEWPPLFLGTSSNITRSPD